MQPKLVKARSEFKASLANMTKEELEALAAKLTEESKETDSKVANLKYALETKGQKAAWDAVKTFLDKQSVKWNYALGLITLYEFFDKPQKEISFAMLDTVLRLLYSGSLESEVMMTESIPIAAAERKMAPTFVGFTTLSSTAILPVSPAHSTILSADRRFSLRNAQSIPRIRL